MRWIPFFILFGLGSGALAQGVSVHVTPDRRVLLRGTSAELSEEVAQLQNLKLVGPTQCDLQSLRCEGEECELEATACFPESYRQHFGRTFAVSGPNCFGTALKLSGFVPTFRGIDVGEFQAFVDASCKVVDQPRAGDIGVFEARGFAFTHAYIYLSPTLGLDKPGVDYLGQTPVALKYLSGIIYRNIATTECRRYSSDPSVCSNKHYYLRCSGIPEIQDEWFIRHQKEVQNMELAIANLIDQKRFTVFEEEIIRELNVAIQRLETEVKSSMSSKIPPKIQAYLLARVKGMAIQMKFFKQK